LGFDRITIDNLTQGELLRVKYKNKFLGIGFADFDKSQVGVKCVINYL
jgi:hypothetical protein